MLRVRGALVAAILSLSLIGPASRAGEAVSRDPMTLAQAVETRAAATSFAQLETFGEAASKRSDREGLNRLYHVAWILLNQGEFEKAQAWNGRLEAAARAQGDQRYLEIARLNALTIRYDSGDTAAAREMARIADTAQDWFVKAHATRLTALALMDEDRIGDGLRLLSEADAEVPENAPFAATARAGLWEMVGIGLMKLNDIDGATTAFGRFEIDHANPDYPRPDFDSLYNLTRLSVQVGDLALAQRLYEAHHRLAQRANIESLSVYDANLCAMVAQARQAPREVLACLAPFGPDLGPAEFLAPLLLPVRAIAYAQTGQVAAARRDMAEIRRRVAAGAFREEGYTELPHVEAELLFAEGRSAEAYEKLKAYFLADRVQSARRFSAGIRQVTGDMQEQLAERRLQLETARANTALQADVIAAQRWVLAIALVFALTAAGLLLWQWRLAGELRAARRRAEDATRSKSEFLANMSHEIRTPLNGVVAMADALSRRSLAARDKEMVEIIRSSGVTLERLLSDILDSAKIEAGQVAIETVPFQLGRLVREIEALWRMKAEAKGVRLEARLAPELDGFVCGDVVRIRQVVTNLVSNALKFTEAGSVRLSVEPAGAGRVRFVVEDTGVGFEPAQKDRIFGRFHQADGSITRRFGGTGLGLSISRDLAELMGGELDCDSVPGRGSRFWLDIPLPAAQGEASTPAASAAEPQALRILLADDHPANRLIIEALLAETDIELVSVADGREAVEAFAKGGFDLVLMDMQMPVMDGLSATAAIRAMEAERDLGRTPIVMLTANAMAEHVQASLEAGADGHLAKPITTASLFDGIARALDSQADAKAS
ncbi:MAG: ATP-binding protein [Phenylobacterium sp.]|uniref:hybrid sensor histidine kinase/response regulator n=1 Tax=Phenylobacterium sp. TaxID=1871053 RepID=UPI00391B5B32